MFQECNWEIRSQARIIVGAPNETSSHCYDILFLLFSPLDFSLKSDVLCGVFCCMKLNVIL